MSVARVVAVLVFIGCGTSTDGNKSARTTSRSAETEAAAPDLFLCGADRRCHPFTAESVATMVDDSSRSERAWCFEAPIRGAQNDVSCFVSLEECTRRAKLDLFADGPCMQHDARTVLAALYGARDASRP